MNTVRNDILELSKTVSDFDMIKQALDEIYVAEGSDWFWWYGEPNNSGQDNVFDFIFREHLKNAYKWLDKDYPPFLDLSIIAAAYQNLSGEENYNQIGTNCEYIDSFDLIDGPVYRDDKLFDKIEYGFDSNNMFFRLYLNPNFKDSDSLRPRISHFYVYLKTNSRTRSASSVRVSHMQDSICSTLKQKFHSELMLTFLGKVMYPATLSAACNDNLWITNEFQNINMPYNDLVDISISFDDLSVKKGQKVELSFIAGCNGVCKAFMPKDSLVQISRPR